MPISFFQEDISFKLDYETSVTNWLNEVASYEGFNIQDLSIIFTSDNYLLDINGQYLGHDYFTDIITFDYVNNWDISGDIFISIDRVEDNAAHYQVSFNRELLRVMVHGLLHLCGYPDATDEEKLKMRAKENTYLNKLELF